MNRRKFIKIITSFLAAIPFIFFEYEEEEIDEPSLTKVSCSVPKQSIYFHSVSTSAVVDYDKADTIVFDDPLSGIEYQLLLKYKDGRLS